MNQPPSKSHIRISTHNTQTRTTTHIHPPTCTLCDGELTIPLLPDLAGVVGELARLVEDHELVVLLLDVADQLGERHADTTSHLGWGGVRWVVGGNGWGGPGEKVRGAR